MMKSFLTQSSGISCVSTFSLSCSWLFNQNIYGDRVHWSHFTFPTFHGKTLSLGIHPCLEGGTCAIWEPCFHFSEKATRHFKRILESSTCAHLRSQLSFSTPSCYKDQGSTPGALFKADYTVEDILLSLLDTSTSAALFKADQTVEDILLSLLDNSTPAALFKADQTVEDILLSLLDTSTPAALFKADQTVEDILLSLLDTSTPAVLLKADKTVEDILLSLATASI